MEVVRTYYENGKLENEYCQINNKKEGICKKYYENGQLYAICNYVDGKKMGNIKTIMEMENYG